MHPAQQIRLLQRMYKIISEMQVTKLFVMSSYFEDDFNDFFNNLNIVIQFLFYTKSCSMSKKDLYEILRAYERGICFSILYYDMSLSTSIKEFIETLFKIGKTDFLYDSLTPILTYTLNVDADYIKRLIIIVCKRIKYQELFEDEQKVLKVTRIQSLENILEKYKEDDIQQNDILPDFN